MQGTKDRTLDLGTTAEVRRGGRRILAGGALTLALLAGSAAAAAWAADLDGEPRSAGRASDASDADGQAPAGPTVRRSVASPEAEREQPSYDVADAPPAAPAGNGAADTVPAGTYGARVLGEGWDERGRYVLIDRGRLADGPPAEPGVDGTRPVVFDTGAVAERRRVDLADGHSLRFARSGGEPSYGPGSWADFVTELSGRDGGVLATVQVDADGRLVSLEEPYRP